MSTNPPEPHSAVDDFNSLGIRFNEARPRIIRQAAARKAEMLHRRQLAGDHPSTDEDVTNLCLTLYKILDPRRRMTTTERALLSQIEPIPPIESRWVHPRSKQPVKRPLGQRHGFGAVAYESLSTGQASFPDPDAPLPTQWQLFLERWVVYARQRVIWATLLLALLVGMLLARQFHVRNHIAEEAWQPVHVPSNKLDGTHDAAGKPAVQPAPAPAAGDPTPTPQAEPTPSPKPVPTGPEPAEPVSMNPAPSEPAAPLPPPATAGDGAEEPPSLQDELDQMMEQLQPFLEPSTSPLPAPSSGDGTAEPPSEPPPNPFTRPAENPLPQPPPPAVDMPADPPPVAPAAENPPARAAQPGDAELATARERLLNLLADRPAAVTETGRELAVDDILDMRLGAAPGSADIWVISEVAAERLIGLGKFQRAAALIAELEQSYAVDPPELTLAITARLAKNVQNLVEHRQLVRWALVSSERFLQSEQFDAASEITRSVSSSLNKVNEPSLRTQMSQRRDAIVIMKRMAETSQRILQTHSLDDVSASDAIQVGRYRCLMLRDWTAGLAWLAQGSDPRLAQAAASEILWLGNPNRSTSDALQLANNWLEAGARLHGRMGDSAKLHAYDLLTTAAAELADPPAGGLPVGGLEAGELQQRLETLRKELVDLLPSDTAMPPVDAAAPAGGLAPVGMFGRLLIDGKDRGAAIRYEPGTAIDQNTLTQILRALGQPDAPCVLEFQGTLRLEKPTTIQVVAGGASAANGGQLVRVDRQAQALVPSVRGESVTLDLPAGPHELFWRLDTKLLDQGFFFVVDVQTEQRLPVQLPANAKPLPTDLPINLVSGR